MKSTSHIQMDVLFDDLVSISSLNLGATFNILVPYVGHF